MGENYSDTEHTALELLNRFAADGWELADLQDYREGGDGSSQWEAVRLLTAYTCPKPGCTVLRSKYGLAVWAGLGVLARAGACRLPRSSAAGCLGGVICGGSKSVERVCGAFGLTAGPGASIVPVSRGAMGRVWCVDLGGERYAVKELFWESDEESVRPEVTFTAHLGSAGIRLPGSLPGRGGRFLQELAAGHGGGWLRLYRWIDGVPADLADPGLAVAIGGLAGRLHALAWPAAGAAGPWAA